MYGDTFNFAFDKESSISACWGKDINETPAYDPIGPQELIFKIGNTFNLNEFLADFNFLANIKVKVDKTEFKNIENVTEALTQENLTCLSTLASVVLIFENNLNVLNLDDILTFIKYIHKFKLSVIVQINTSSELTYSDIIKLKLLGSSIQLKTDNDFNADIFIKNINALKEHNIIISSKIFVNKKTYDEVFKLVDFLDENTSMKIFCNEPFISTSKYLALQEKFLAAKLINIRLATCGYTKFNAKQLNIKMEPADCDAMCFSIYIEDRKVYPCEYNKMCCMNLADCTSLHSFWYDKNFVKVRASIVDNNCC